MCTTVSSALICSVVLQQHGAAPDGGAKEWRTARLARMWRRRREEARKAWEITSSFRAFADISSALIVPHRGAADEDEGGRTARLVRRWRRRAPVPRGPVSRDRGCRRSAIVLKQLVKAGIISINLAALVAPLIVAAANAAVRLNHIILDAGKCPETESGNCIFSTLIIRKLQMHHFQRPLQVVATRRQPRQPVATAQDFLILAQSVYLPSTCFWPWQTTCSRSS